MGGDGRDGILGNVYAIFIISISIIDNYIAPKVGESGYLNVQTIFFLFFFQFQDNGSLS